MTITEAIKQLETLKKAYGDVQVVTDCQFCGKSTAPTVIVQGPPVVKLTSRDQ